MGSCLFLSFEGDEGELSNLKKNSCTAQTAEKSRARGALVKISFCPLKKKIMHDLKVRKNYGHDCLQVVQ